MSRVSFGLRSWVQVLSQCWSLCLSFISLGAGTAWQVISQGGKARMQDNDFWSEPIFMVRVLICHCEMWSHSMLMASFLYIAAHHL